MDRDQQRQNKRSNVAGFSCTSGAELTPFKSPTGRPGADCDPTPAAPIPFAVVTPPPCPPPLPVPLNLPPGLTIVNDATTAYCPSTGGYSVTGTTAATVSSGAQQQVVLFTVIENITENQLNYLYEVVPTSSTAIIAASLSGATSTVIDLTHLNYNQSEELIITVQDAKFAVDTLAVEQARNLLVCQVENDLQVASCPTSAYFGVTAPPGLPYLPVATAATGTVLVTFALLPSTGGQTAFTEINIPSLTAAAAQANSIALSQVENELRCVYGNAATAAACCTSEAPDNNLGFTNCVPATGPSIPGSATAVGYFSVDANTVFSAVSLSEANSVARELSRNALNCYFPSVGVTATCDGAGSTSLGLTGLSLTGPFAPASTTSVYLEPGAVILYDLEASVTAASEQAATLALASLNCFWSNAAVTVFCPPSGTFTAINNITYNLAASPSASIKYSSTVAANSVISYASQAEANTQALQLASANVSCIYCNNEIAPTCSGGVNETIGTEADVICNVLAEIAQNTAVSLGNILVSNSEGGLNCCYGNEGVTNTIQCTTGAYFSNDPTSSFTSVDSFFIPANVITVCASETLPPEPPLLFPYSSLYATDVIQVGCCSDILLCDGVTGSATALPTLWAYQTDLFNIIATGATFYSDDSGTSPYSFPVAANYVVSRAGARAYRALTGDTGYSVGLTYCDDCTSLDSYVFRGASAGSYASASGAYTDIFCDGPTAQILTLYTNASSPFITSATSAWFTDACGLSAFTPAASSATADYFYAGSILGATGYMLLFSQTGSNVATYNAAYTTSSCPVSRYAYAVYVGDTACTTGGTAITLYGALEAPSLFTTSTEVINLYTAQFNDSSVYTHPTATGYVNYVAADESLYTREIVGASSLQPPQLCTALYKLTVQYSNTAADDVCNHPNFFDSNSDGVFNDNIRTVWSDVENPFADSSTAKFYTSPLSFDTNLFKPGVSGPVYLSEFSPGDTYRGTYREYSWSTPASTLHSYTGTFKPSPFLTNPIWAHSATASYISEFRPGSVSNTKFLLSSDGCTANNTYSDIKLALPSQTASLAASYKTLPVQPIAGDLYSNTLLFDGIGYELSSNASGTATNANFILNDLTKVGAGFTGAIVRAADHALIGDGQLPMQGTAIPTYISSIDTTSGAVSLGGYYNKVNTSFSNTAVHVTGFKIEAGNWTSSQFTCYGDLCELLDVGHSLFSYYVAGATTINFSIGYVTQIDGDTVYYTGAPGYSDFSSYDIGTGASHGSGHVYIQGRQFARFWEDEYKAQPLYFDLQSNTYNYIWSQEDGSTSAYNAFAVAKNFILGNTAGSTADFIVAGVSYTAATIPPRPYEYDSDTTYDPVIPLYSYSNYVYSCTGSVEETVVPIFVVAYRALVNSCCELITTSEGVSYDPVAACSYYDTYGELAVSSGDYCIELSNNQFLSSSNTALSGAFVVDSLGGGTGKFASCYFSDGYKVGVYPCSSKYDVPYAVGGSAWMRKYLGFYDASDPYAVPFDDTYPGGGTAVDNPVYWASNDYVGGGTTGYVFKEYVPDLYAATGCNCGNFMHVDYGLTSGERYSIWSATADAWADVSQQDQIVGSTALMPFNECATSCENAYICIDREACDDGAVGAVAYSPSMSEAGESPVIEFSPTVYDVYSPFNFGAMPSVGGTAEDLKAEATKIAQNIVNAFVNCYYFNDPQIGETCAAGLYIIQQGYANAGEIVSSLSKEDANTRAQQLADARTICIGPDQIGGPGCNETRIGNADATNLIGAINLDFEKNGCSFTPTLTFTTDIVYQTAIMRKLKICSASGTVEILVPDYQGEYLDEGNEVNIAVRRPDES